MLKITKTNTWLAGTLFFISPVEAFAYIGPGLGAGIVGITLGLLVAGFIALFAIVYYPVKRSMQKLKRKLFPVLMSNKLEKDKSK